MASAENRNATEPPINRPMKVLTSATLIWVSIARKMSPPSSGLPTNSAVLPKKPMLASVYFRPSSLAIVSM